MMRRCLCQSEGARATTSQVRNFRLATRLIKTCLSMNSRQSVAHTMVIWMNLKKPRCCSYPSVIDLKYKLFLNGNSNNRVKAKFLGFGQCETLHEMWATKQQRGHSFWQVQIRDRWIEQSQQHQYQRSAQAPVKVSGSPHELTAAVISDERLNRACDLR